MDVVLSVAIAAAITVITAIALMFDEDRLKKQAKALGLASDGTQLYGVHRGVEVSVSFSNEGSVHRPRNYTVYSATVSDIPADLDMTSDVTRSMSGDPFVGLDINVGIPVVDENFIIEAAERESTGAFLRRPGVVDALNRLRNDFIYVHLEHGEVVVKNRGFDSAPTMLRSLDDLADAIEQMSRAAHVPETKPETKPNDESSVPIAEADGHW